MDKTVLVEKNIQDGKELLKALDSAHFPVNGALWRFYSEMDKWKLIIISDYTDRSGPIDKYSKIQKIIKEIKEPIEISLDEIKITTSSERDIKLLKKMIKTNSDAIDDIRFANSTINGVFFEDLYIYRLS